MMHKIGLADELAETREEIARLKEREAALHAAILASDGNVPDGRTSRVEVVTRRRKVFDKGQLPDDVLKNPKYWSEKLSTHVHILPLEPQRRAGWPIKRVSSMKLVHH